MDFKFIAKLALTIVIICAQLVCAQQETEVLGDEVINHDNRNRFSFLDLMVTPIRETFERAKNIFTPHSNSVTGRLDTIRLETFRIFMRLYNKTYSADEIPRRMALFFRRRAEIVESQKLFAQGRSMFAMKENEYTDWEEDEMKSLAGVSLPNADQLEPEEGSLYEDDDYQSTVQVRNRRFAKSFDIDDSGNMIVRAEIPATKDWRSTGCVSTPIDQKKCGACYAIATISVVESMRCIRNVSSPILSSQQIVDCATRRNGYDNHGCDGGWPTRVLKYLQDHGTVAREKCYPFVARQTACRIRQVRGRSNCTVSATSSGRRLQYKVLRNERDILYHVANTGPVITVMKATDRFLYYAKGIFDDAKCSRKRDDVDHAIVIVGYGRRNGIDYWIIKNSWGTTTWGEEGYGLFRRGKLACSIGHWGWVVTN